MGVSPEDRIQGRTNIRVCTGNDRDHRQPSGIGDAAPKQGTYRRLAKPHDRLTRLTQEQRGSRTADQQPSGPTALRTSGAADFRRQRDGPLVAKAGETGQPRRVDADSSGCRTYPKRSREMRTTTQSRWRRCPSTSGAGSTSRSPGRQAAASRRFCRCSRCSRHQRRAATGSTAGGPISSRPAERARARSLDVGLIFQSFNLIGDMSVYENVEYPLTLRGATPARARRAGSTPRSNGSA